VRSRAISEINQMTSRLSFVYFMAVIDSVFYQNACVTYKRETLAVVTFHWSEIMGIYK